MVPRRPLVAVPIVAGEPGHQLLRILVVQVDQELGRHGAAEHTGGPVVVQQFDVPVLAETVGESLRSVGHQHMVLARCGTHDRISVTPALLKPGQERTVSRKTRISRPSARSAYAP
jgi:hypothetical protein